ncbi:MAG TPA: porphobilinogen synthase, partial [Deltaproteobacteria bacterium]|nr:porphobilinogen synthase [Deltaproteobacteria bacterium]
MPFPKHRPRRLRKNEIIRKMVRETTLSVDDLILPLFITFGKGKKIAIKSMPGHYQLSVDNLAKEIKEIKSLGIPAVILFGIPEHKDEVGSEAYNPKGIIQKVVKAIKDKAPELMVITDVCMCEYTSHGHCGVIKHGDVDNDATLELLA